MTSSSRWEGTPSRRASTTGQGGLTLALALALATSASAAVGVEKAGRSAQILTAEGVDSSMVLRRWIPGGVESSYFVIRTVGIKAIRVKTTVAGRSGGPRVRETQLVSKEGETNTWRLGFEKLRPQTPFDLEIRGEVERGFQEANARGGVTRVIADVGVGEVWLMELGRGASLPHPNEQTVRTVDALGQLGMVVRVLDLRRRPVFGVEADSRRWIAVEAATLLNHRGIPNFVPYFARQLAKEVRTRKDNVPAEEGTPVVLGFVFVDENLRVDSRDGGLRDGCGLRAVAEVNAAVQGVSNDAHARFDVHVLDRKRDGLPPGETPVILDFISEGILRGPFDGFPVEDASGFLRVRPVLPWVR